MDTLEAPSRAECQVNNLKLTLTRVSEYKIKKHKIIANRIVSLGCLCSRMLSFDYLHATRNSQPVDRIQGIKVAKS